MVIGVCSACDHIGQAAGCGFQWTADHGMFFPESDHVLVEPEKIPVETHIIPVQPGYVVVLTVTIVIPVLGVSEFVTGQDHRRAAAAHQDRDGIAHHLEAKVLDHGIVCRTLHPAVPAAVVIGTVCIVPAVCLIVLMIVGEKVVEGKAVMAGDKIDR